MLTYQDFLTQKRIVAPTIGRAVDADDVHPALFSFQCDLVVWAVRKGRAALFADTGLGKTRMQVEWARLIGGRTLIIAPLSVARQTVKEAQKIGVAVQYVRRQADIDGSISITNYEMIDHFDFAAFNAVVLDESSILKALDGETRRRLTDLCADVPYRLCCTATPAPNDHVELGNHGEFLGALDASLMLSRFFINDTSQSGVYRLKRHAERDFWRWVASWAVCAAKPSDIPDPSGGRFSDDGFDLPPLALHQHTVGVDHVGRQGETGELFIHGALSATELYRELRRTSADRARRVAELLECSDPNERWVIWCNTNDEADAVRHWLPEAVEVRGSDSLDEKEARLVAFSRGEIRVLVTKPSIAGFGMNWQHCAHMAFVGLSYSYEQLYQALRRSWRFGQTRPVHAHLVVAESEGGVLASIRRKRDDHEALQRGMVAAMREVQCGAGDASVADLGGVESATGEGWTLYRGDCVRVARELPDESVDFSVYSPPFSNIYVYSDDPRDMGNTEDDAEFFRHFDFLIPELYRLTKPGRLTAVHCKNLPMYAGRDGRAGLRDFRGEIIRAFERHGWVYHSEVRIWKCPVTEMQRTKAHGLLYRTLKRDAAFSRQGLAEYLVILRKWAEPEARELVPKVTHNEDEFPLEQWQRYASPVWMDIDPTDVLNVAVARDDRDEKHLCPLQLEVIRRAVTLWSNPGDVVFSPFAGIGSEGVVSLELGRRFVGAELNPRYWTHACRHLDAVHRDKQTGLFEDVEAAS